MINQEIKQLEDEAQEVGGDIAKRGRPRKYKGNLAQAVADRSRCPLCKLPTTEADYVNARVPGRLTKNCLACRQKNLAAVLKTPKREHHRRRGKMKDRLSRLRTIFTPLYDNEQAILIDPDIQKEIRELLRTYT